MKILVNQIFTLITIKFITGFTVFMFLNNIEYYKIKVELSMSISLAIINYQNCKFQAHRLYILYTVWVNINFAK